MVGGAGGGAGHVTVCGFQLQVCTRLKAAQPIIIMVSNSYLLDLARYSSACYYLLYSLTTRKEKR